MWVCWIHLTLILKYISAIRFSNLLSQSKKLLMSVSKSLYIYFYRQELKIKSVNDICTKLSREMYEGFHDIQER